MSLPLISLTTPTAALTLEVTSQATVAKPNFNPDAKKVIPDNIFANLEVIAKGNPTDPNIIEAAKKEITAALTLEPSNPQEIDAGLSTDDDPDKAVDAAVGADDPNSGDTNFTFPIKTSWAVLFEFQKQLNDNTYFFAHHKPLYIGALSELTGSTEYHIRQMNFDTYWQMRNLQIQYLNLLADQLRLALDPATGETESTDNPLRKAANNYLEHLGIGPSLEDRKKYLDMMQELFKDVSISVEQDPKGQQVANIKKDGTTLVTMTETLGEGRSNMTYKINPDLLKSDLSNGQNMKMLKDAVELCVDQATRLLERSQDTQRRFRISGYENSPELVLQMYQSALLHELKPTIAKPTLEAWDTIINQDPTHPEQNKYKQAKALYDKMNEISTNKTLTELRELAVQNILKQDPPTSAPPNDQVQTTNAQLKVKNT